MELLSYSTQISNIQVFPWLSWNKVFILFLQTSCKANQPGSLGAFTLKKWLLPISSRFPFKRIVLLQMMLPLTQVLAASSIGCTCSLLSSIVSRACDLCTPSPCSRMSAMVSFPITLRSCNKLLLKSFAIYYHKVVFFLITILENAFLLVVLHISRAFVINI